MSFYMTNSLIPQIVVFTRIVATLHIVASLNSSRSGRSLIQCMHTHSQEYIINEGKGVSNSLYGCTRTPRKVT